MRNSLNTVWSNFLKLVRFLTWYGVAVAFLFYLLPIAGLVVESYYEALNSTVRFLAVIGFFVVIIVWHVVNIRDRWRAGA